MKRAEITAWSGLAALLSIAAILLAGGAMYHTNMFWAGAILVLGQALVVGLAGWGLMLSRQADELRELPPMGGEKLGAAASSMRGGLGFEDEALRPQAEGATDIKTLETGFQRIIVALTAIGLLVLAAVTAYLTDLTFAWAKANPDKPFPIAGPLGKPQTLDELALVMGLGAAGIYLVTWWLSRGKRSRTMDGDAVESNFTLGAVAMVVLAAATVLGYLQVAYASEVAAMTVAAVLALQGLELLVNSMRSYSGIEELDQDAVDLQRLPLVPMLSSVWLNGVRMLLAESLGLGSRRAGRGPGVVARLMPRAILTAIVIAIVASCFRVVPPGEVAILERLGVAQGPVGPNGQAQVKPLTAGLHITMPWPIDRLVMIPTQQLQFTDVGTELHAPKGWQNVDFQFWTIRDTSDPTKVEQDEYVTGDPGQQMLETYVGIWWRVKDPVKFYHNLSHSDFFEHKAGATTTLPIYAALVQQTAEFAVTRTFAVHTLDELLTSDRRGAEMDCQNIMQRKLDAAGSGIQVVDLTIKDLHPPYGVGRIPDINSPNHVKLGPAAAYENVVSMREYAQMLEDQAYAYAETLVTEADGKAAAVESKAQEDSVKHVADAEGDAVRLSAMMTAIDAQGPEAAKELQDLAKMQTLYGTLSQVLTPPNKIVVDPRVKVNLWQTTKSGLIPMQATAGQ